MTSGRDLEHATNLFTWGWLRAGAQISKLLLEKNASRCGGKGTFLQWDGTTTFVSAGLRGSATMHILCTDVLSFQDGLLTYPPLLASPWRRCRLSRNTCMGSDDSPAPGDGSVPSWYSASPSLCFSAKAGTLVLLYGGYQHTTAMLV